MKKLLLALTSLALGTSAFASSHREAPFITKNPKVDATDFYLFKSYEPTRGNFVTLIANYLPLQDAYGGPNYFSLDPEALYEIHVDNTGDAVEDITFQFRFQTTLANNGQGLPLTITAPDGGASQSVPIPLINAQPVGFADGGFLATPGGFQAQLETYSVNVVRGARRVGTPAAVTNKTGGSAVFQKPLDNIGAKTFPGNSYANYAAAHIYTVTIPGCAVDAKLFVGQRAESFAVNLGTIFDLVNAPAAFITNDANRGVAGTATTGTIGSKNVTTLSLEIDRSCLTSATGGDIIGAWTSASVRQARVINPAGGFSRPTREGGAWAQVSRLGNPLVNEVVIGVPDKDKFNASEPKNDLTNFAKYVTNPTLPVLLNVLFGVSPPTEIPRTDLITAFLTGVTGVNAFPAAANPVLAEFLRLNTALPATPAASQNDLGAAGCFVGDPPVLTVGAATCDPAGFPNGRRPGDDVTDVALRVVMGYLLPSTKAPNRATPFHDGVRQNASQFDTTFPYLKTPNPGT